MPFATLTALRAGFTYLPSAFKSSNAAGVVGGKIHVLDVVAPAKPGETIELPDPTPTVIEEEPIHLATPPRRVSSPRRWKTGSSRGTGATPGRSTTKAWPTKAWLSSWDPR